MSLASLAAAVFLIGGCAFFLAGTLGLLRFPDTLSRLHTLTKADNVGLLLICIGLAIQSGSLRASLQLGLVWLLALTASTVSAHLVARRSHRQAKADGR